MVNLNDGKRIDTPITTNKNNIGEKVVKQKKIYILVYNTGFKSSLNKSYRYFLPYCSNPADENKHLLYQKDMVLETRAQIRTCAEYEHVYKHAYTIGYAKDLRFCYNAE